MLGGQEHGLDVDLHDATPVLLGLVEDGSPAADPDVVVEEVETAEAIEGGLDHPRAILGAGDIRLEREALAPLLLDHASRLLGEVDLAIHHDDPRACPGQQDGGRAAVADARARRSRTRHDGDFPAQSPVIRHIEARGHGLPRDFQSVRAVGSNQFE